MADHPAVDERRQRHAVRSVADRFREVWARRRAAQEKAAERDVRVLHDTGGSRATGGIDVLPPGIFWPLDMRRADRRAPASPDATAAVPSRFVAVVVVASRIAARRFAAVAGTGRAVSSGGMRPMAPFRAFGPRCAVAVAFRAGDAGGGIAGYVAGRSERMKRGRSLGVIALNCRAVVIVLAYIWVGLNDAAAVLAVSSPRAHRGGDGAEGTRALDPAWPRWRRVPAATGGGCASWCFELLPYLAPPAAVDCRSPGRSCWWWSCWPANGVGYALNLYFRFRRDRHPGLRASLCRDMLLVERRSCNRWNGAPARGVPTGALWAFRWAFRRPIQWTFRWGRSNGGHSDARSDGMPSLRFASTAKSRRGRRRATGRAARYRILRRARRGDRAVRSLRHRQKHHMRILLVWTPRSRDGCGAAACGRGDVPEPLLLPWLTVEQNLRLVVTDSMPQPDIAALLAMVRLPDAAGCIRGSCPSHGRAGRRWPEHWRCRRGAGAMSRSPRWMRSSPPRWWTW